MTRRFRARFDGRVFIPIEPVDLPVNQAIELEVADQAAGNGEALMPTAEVIKQRLDSLRATAGMMSAPVLSDESMRRENMYDERL